MKFKVNKPINRNTLEKVAEETIVKSWERSDRLREWQTTFAWLPKMVGDNDCRWLEPIKVRYPEARGIGTYRNRPDLYYYIYCDEIRYLEKASDGLPEYAPIDQED